MRHVFLLNVEEVKQRLSHLFENQGMRWLAGNGKWPITIHLGLPNQKTALNNISAISDWVAQWRQWQGAGQLQWGSRNWSTLGKQQLPEKIIFSNALEIVQWLNQSALWEKMCHRYQQLTQRWPALQQCCTKYHEVLASYADEDFIHLQNVLAWLIDHPHSQIYLRELPIPQIDTKWIETRKSTLYRLLKIIKAIDNTPQDFYAVAGLKCEPYLVRMRILDEDLRTQLKDHPHQFTPWLERALHLIMQKKPEDIC